MSKIIVGYVGKAKEFKPLNFVVKGKIKLNEKESEVKKNDK